MAVTAQRFYPHSTDWDGTDPAGGDIRKCETTVPANSVASSVDFGTGGSSTITAAPYVAGRTTPGLTSALGWAINSAGADGMDSTTAAKRYIRPGAWTFQGTVSAAPAASVGSVTIGFNVYRVAASPSTTRTLLFSDSVALGAGTVVVAGTSWTRTTGSQSEIYLLAGETLQVTYTLAGTGQLGGLVVTFETGAGHSAPATNANWLDVSSPGVRTAKKVTGIVYDTASAPAPGATAKLFAQASDSVVGTQATAANGSYQFDRPDNDVATYYVLGYSDDTHHGTSDRSLVAS